MLGRKRHLSKSSLDSSKLDVKRLYLPRWKNIMHEVYRQGGWDGGITCSNQSDSKFRFSGSAFRRYCKIVFGPNLSLIYFPAGYVGKVVSALSKAGIDVTASDISPHWVGVLKQKGLQAERRSINEIPDKQFDAVVAFEPYCADSSVLSYMAILKILTKRIPYLEIVCDAFSINGDFNLNSLIKPNGIIEQPKHPHSFENMIRIGYDYGAQYRYHIIRNRSTIFCIHSLHPKPKAAKRAQLDLAVLEAEEKLPEIISLSNLAKFFGVTKEAMAASVYRLNIALNDRLDVEYMCTDGNPFEMALFKRRLSLLENPEELDTRVFYRRMSIRNC